ncbi:MAG: glycosyltransferase [Patescibacteria group bacterium]
MISLISTLFNENENLQLFLDDIKNQTQKPEEVVFVDAGSTDGSFELMAGKLKTLVKEGCNRSEGRNLAINEAKGDVIAVCDGGTRLDSNWLKILTAHFKDPNIHVVSGFFKPDARTFFEKCLSSATIPILEEIEEEKFLPSSRSLAFRRQVWKDVKGYPQWLPVCEDLIFDIKLKKNGFTFKFEPKAIVYWRPRKNIQAFFKQYYMYAKGDGHAKLWFARHVIRYTAYFTGLLLIYLSFSVSFLWLLPFFAAQLGYFSKFYYRYMGHFEQDPEYKIGAAFPLISFLVVTGDIAKMVGYPVGIYERVTKKIKFEEYRK